MSCSISYQYLSKSHKNLSKIRFSVAHPMKYETIWWTCGGMKTARIFENRYSWKNDTIFNIILVWNIICKIDVNVTLRFLHFSFHTPPPSLRLFLIFSNPPFLHLLFPAPFLIYTLSTKCHLSSFSFYTEPTRMTKEEKGFCITPPRRKKKTFSLSQIFSFCQKLFSPQQLTLFFNFFSHTLYFQHPLYSNNDNFLFFFFGCSFDEHSVYIGTMYIVVGILPYVPRYLTFC